MHRSGLPTLIGWRQRIPHSLLAALICCGAAQVVFAGDSEGRENGRHAKESELRVSLHDKDDLPYCTGLIAIRNEEDRASGEVVISSVDGVDGRISLSFDFTDLTMRYRLEVGDEWWAEQTTEFIAIGSTKPRRAIEFARLEKEGSLIEVTTFSFSGGTALHWRPSDTRTKRTRRVDLRTDIHNLAAIELGTIPATTATLVLRFRNVMKKAEREMGVDLMSEPELKRDFLDLVLALLEESEQGESQPDGS